MNVCLMPVSNVSIKNGRELDVSTYHSLLVRVGLSRFIFYRVSSDFSKATKWNKGIIKMFVASIQDLVPEIRVMKDYFYFRVCLSRSCFPSFVN